MRKITLLLSAILLCGSLSARTWHVSPSGSDANEGTSDAPVKTISKAAFHALAGDTVLIREGVYRERVSPANPGINDRRRITYMAVPDEEVWLKGSEIVKGWKRVPKSKSVWSVKIPNTFFGDFNPFDVEIYGDWLLEGHGLHLGEVYIDGESLQEYLDESELVAQDMSWSVNVDDEYTTIKAYFGGQDPNKLMTEINVRSTCFFPKTTGISYITVKGLKIAQAATQWSPPTGEQVGIIGPNWSRGWIIEDCEILQSKCVGICIGKDRASGHNMSSLYRGQNYHSKMGFTREIEAIFKAYELGWNGDNVGHHLIQNNKIYECNQAGIVGHLGCIFSTIRNNEIYDINVDTPIGGHETGGIKLHAGIDVVIENNCITHCKRGVWIDWQAQGMHVRNNIFENNNSEDLFIEVSHGPTLVYNNILLSARSILLRTQGVAFFNNLIGGNVDGGGASGRYTPYHMPHSTAIKGLHNNPGGDWHFYNNIFLAQANRKTSGELGLAGCKNYPASIEEFKEKSVSKSSESVAVLTFKFPVYMDANLYFGKNSVPHPGETGFTRYADKEIPASLERREDGHYYLNVDLDAALLKSARTVGVNTNMLGEVVIPELPYENRDQTEFIFATDYYGKERNVDAPFIGPFEGAFDTSKPIW